MVFNADGRIWSSGVHNVFVNGKPTRLYVPESTITETYAALIESDEGVPLGIDHIPDGVLEDNPILKKMELHNVGTGRGFVTDGKSIYMTESEITNTTIEDLGLRGELPMYSIVGPIVAEKCERDEVDLVLREAAIERVDFVERGGCSTCNVGEQPKGDMIILSKLSMEEAPMTEEHVEEVIETTETTEEVVEDVEVAEEVDTVEVEEEPEPEPALSKDDVLELIREALSARDSEQKEVEAKQASVEEFIEAGYAVPAEREVLTELAGKDEELFKKLMASRPKIVKFHQISRHVEASEPEKEPEIDPLTDMPILEGEDVQKIIE